VQWHLRAGLPPYSWSRMSHSCIRTLFLCITLTYQTRGLRIAAVRVRLYA
jgi:hypothetical protein